MSAPGDAKKSRPVPSPDLGIGYHLRRTYMSLHRRLKTAVAGHGITPDQYVVLWVLDASGDMTQKEIHERVYSDGNTIAAMLGRMERKGWIRRERHSKDRRARRVRVTPKGQAMRWRIYALTGRVHRQALRGFSPAERRMLFEFLDRMYESVERDGRNK